MIKGKYIQLLLIHKIRDITSFGVVNKLYESSVKNSDDYYIFD
jgi:hypothetical protein